MEKYQGVLRKMKAHLADPIEYSLSLSEKPVLLNTHLGKTITLDFTGNIYCIQCERKIKKSFQQGFCYPCYQRLLECHLCIIHPERCTVEQGTCPHDDWAHSQCYQHHIIYLANTSGLKVGITRESQVPTRWIDQGAVQAVPIIKVSNRYRAGVVEVALKAFVNDKTNWRAMLKNQVEVLDMNFLKANLIDEAAKALQQASSEFTDDFELLSEQPVQLCYPVEEYPEKVTSLSLEKTPSVSGCLRGIKGQYLLLDHGVINMRKFGGYEIEVSL